MTMKRTAFMLAMEEIAEQEQIVNTAIAVPNDFDEVDTLIDTSCALGTIGTVINEKIENGTEFTPSDEEAISVAVESLYRIGGMRSIIPAKEDLKDKSKLYKLALESISEQIQKAWEAIKAFFKRAFEWIKSIFIKSDSKLEKMQEEVAELEKQLKEDKSGSNVAKEDMEDVNSSVYPLLRTKKHSDVTPETVKILLNSMVDHSIKTYEDISSFIDSLCKELKDVYKSAKARNATCRYDDIGLKIPDIEPIEIGGFKTLKLVCGVDESKEPEDFSDFLEHGLKLHIKKDGSCSGRTELAGSIKEIQEIVDILKLVFAKIKSSRKLVEYDQESIDDILYNYAPIDGSSANFHCFQKIIKHSCVLNSSLIKFYLHMESVCVAAIKYAKVSREQKARIKLLDE